MINFDDYINENKTGSGSGKTNVLLNLIENKPTRH